MASARKHIAAPHDMFDHPDYGHQDQRHREITEECNRIDAGAIQRQVADRLSREGEVGNRDQRYE
ncbi:hypothetical protein D3C72_2442360 [compost metagenome]